MLGPGPSNVTPQILCCTFPILHFLILYRASQLRLYLVAPLYHVQYSPQWEMLHIFLFTIKGAQFTILHRPFKNVVALRGSNRKLWCWPLLWHFVIDPNILMCPRTLLLTFRFKIQKLVIQKLQKVCQYSPQPRCPYQLEITQCRLLGDNDILFVYSNNPTRGLCSTVVWTIFIYKSYGKSWQLYNVYLNKTQS